MHFPLFFLTSQSERQIAKRTPRAQRTAQRGGSPVGETRIFESTETRRTKPDVLCLQGHALVFKSASVAR